MTRKASRVLSVLETLYPETACFLDHGTDYELLLAVILSAQASDRSVNKATARLFRDYPTLESIAKAEPEDILPYIKDVGLGKSKSAYLVRTARLLLSKHGGLVPRDRTALMALPGVGYKTSGVVLAELYDAPYIPVDTHVQRVATRLGLTTEKDPTKTERVLEKAFEGGHLIDIHRKLILFGRNVCHAVKPSCGDCPLREECVYTKAQKKRGQD